MLANVPASPTGFVWSSWFIVRVDAHGGGAAWVIRTDKATFDRCLGHDLNSWYGFELRSFEWFEDIDIYRTCTIPFARANKLISEIWRKVMLSLFPANLSVAAPTGNGTGRDNRRTDLEVDMSECISSMM